MELKSNIKIKSNLYIRSTADGSFSFADTDYIAQILNRAALETLKERAEKSGANLKLSEAQSAVLEPKAAVSAIPDEAKVSDIPIAEAPDQEKVSASIESSAKDPDLSFSINDTAETSPAADSDSETRPVDLSFSLENIAEISAASKSSAASEIIEKLDMGLESFARIDSGEISEHIISTGLDSKIILDSVCCPEKLRAAAQRASFILEDHPEKRLLILCKTESAAEKVRSSISAPISEGSYIGTPDVFAAKRLAALGESAAAISALSAGEKIDLFGSRMRTEDLSEYSFCIITDLDELVSDHIKALLKIIVLLQCGYLLMSDKHRAALEFPAESDYRRNFDKLCDVLPENIERLSIDGSAHNLSGKIDAMMTAMTEGKPANGLCRELISEMESVELTEALPRDAAILCGDKIHAEYVSLLLQKNAIPHTLLREGRAAPMRRLADILWDSHEKVIERDNFIKRFNARCINDDALAEKLFNLLCALTERDPSEGTETARLAEVISIGEIPSELITGSGVKLAVTAINSAAAEEFGKVFIADTDLNEPSARIMYPAAAGRIEPPAVLKLGTVPKVIKNSSGRWICVDENDKAAFGVISPDDVNFVSFISGSMGDAVRKQAYISKNVKPGDSVALKLNGGTYDIVHGSTVIGKMSESFSQNVSSEFDGRKYFDPLPEQISGMRVTNVITVVSCHDPSDLKGIVSPQFSDHHFWYGVEINGFGTVE